MKKITKAQQDAINAAIRVCGESRDKVQGLIDKYNEFLDEWSDEAEAAIKEYNENLHILGEEYEQIAVEAQEYYDERSESWQEHEKGQAYAEWISELENFTLEELDVDLPNRIDEPMYDDWENPENLLPPNEPQA